MKLFSCLFVVLPRCLFEMDHKEEYHDPDYVGTAVEVPEEPQKDPESDKVEKIRNIVRREFGKELEEREKEVDLIHQQ